MIHVNLLSFCQSETCIHDMKKEEAFEIVAKIVFDKGVQLIVGGNPAFETERVLIHIEMCMVEWGYRSAKVAEYCDSIKQENDFLRDLGISDE